MTVTDWGEDSAGATIRLEASRYPGFGELAGASAEVPAPALGVATNLAVSGLRELSDYYVRARIVNSWGFVEYRTLPSPMTTRGYPLVGTDLVWETAADGTLSVHERILDLDDGLSGTAELFLGGVSKGTRTLSAPGRLSWTGLAAPAAPAEARVVVSVYIGTGLYQPAWTAIVIPGSASYLERKWVYDPSARTLTWTDGYPSENVVSNVTAKGKALTIGNNRFNSLAVNLDFSPGVEGGWEISNIVSAAFVVEQSTDPAAVTNVVFPSTLREVGRAAFSGAKNLRRAVFNEGLVDLGTDGSSYGNYCFNGCTSLESIGPLPSTLRIVGMRLFTGCTSLTNDIVWPRGLPVVPEYAFQNTSIRSFKAEYGVTHMGPYGTEARVTSGNNAIRTIDLPVTLQYVAGRMFSDTDLAKGFTANVWYRGFPKLGWHDSHWASMTWGKTTVTNWFEWHHRDEFRAFAETNRQFTIVLPETFKGEGTWWSGSANQVVRWWRDPDQNPPTVMLLR